MVTQESALKLVKAYVQRIQKKGIAIRQAILFGSFAQNTQHQWSDVDVALVADDFVGMVTIDKKPFRDLHIQKRFANIEAHTFNTHEFENGNPFINEIKKTGINVL